jgi:thiamine-monophosphate kinase
MATYYIISEDDFLALIAEKFPNTHPFVILGRGDDCAEIACPPQMAVSTDLFVEDAHFRRRYFSPFETGYKALAVNISDMVAAGAKPLGVSVGLVVPVPFKREEAEGIIDGMAKAASDFDIALTGGDLSRGDKLSFCVTIWGAPAGFVPGGNTHGVKNGETAFLRRGPVNEGDALFLCGQVGLARVGLLCFEEKGRAATLEYPASCRAHLMPEPLVQAGLLLAGHSSCRLMDVSDGLLRDLPRMLKAYGMSYGARVELPDTALHPETIGFAESRKENPTIFAFTGGEDYALLGSCSEKECMLIEEAMKRQPGMPRFLRIGTVTREPGITLNGTPLTATGFDHFS